MVTRRRSSLVPPPTAKAGTYRARPISFAPNVTPDSYDAPSSPSDDDDEDVGEATLFPPLREGEGGAASRKRQKRRDPGHVPRPPNAFMLFRADFVRQKHVPGSIETNHGSLSKIIGSLWRNLPPAEKKHWEQRAKHEKTLHAKRYPGYKYKPVHRTVRRERKAEVPLEEERCEEIAQLLLDGNKGHQLVDKVKARDERVGRKKGAPPQLIVPSAPMGGMMTRGRERASMAQTGMIDFSSAYTMRRRSSSVPPEMPTTLHLPRRPSSASGYHNAGPSSSSSHFYNDPPPYLPQVNTALFHPSYLTSDPFSQQPQQSYNAEGGVSPFDCPPPSFYSPSPAPSSDGGGPLPLYAPQPSRPMDDFLTPSQRMSLSEGRFTAADLTADQRSSLRQSFSWGGNETEVARRFSLSQVDFSALMEFADVRDMDLGLDTTAEPHKDDANWGCVHPDDLVRRSERLSLEDLPQLPPMNTNPFRESSPFHGFYDFNHQEHMHKPYESEVETPFDDFASRDGSPFTPHDHGSPFDQDHPSPFGVNPLDVGGASAMDED